MHIEGDYSLFAHLETVYLGSLARRTLIMRNVREVVEAARGKPILYFPARHDHWLVQTGDGWAAHIAGAIGVSTDAQASWWGGQGDRHRAARADRLLRRRHGRGGARVRGPLRRRDEHRRCWSTSRTTPCGPSLEVAEALGDRLWGVRLDTSHTIVDHSLLDQMGDFDPRGVNPELVAARARARSTGRATARADRRSRAASTPSGSASSSASACRSTSTGSGRA